MPRLVSPPPVEKEQPATNGQATAPPQPHAEPIIKAVRYPEVKVKLWQWPDALTAKTARTLLGWQTEDEFRAKCVEKQPLTKLDQWGYGDDYLLTDSRGNKVRCLANADNRELRDWWFKSLRQIILNGQWAGVLMCPEEVEMPCGLAKLKVGGKEYAKGEMVRMTDGTVNGSTIVVQRTGEVTSGQHTGVALIDAHQMWEDDPDRADPAKAKYPFWACVKDADGNLTGPVIETIVVTGLSTNERIRSTTDNCVPRSEADVFYTSPTFRTRRRASDGVVESRPMDERKEMSKMLAAAFDLLWDRTAAQGYKTLPEAVGFLDRHRRLIKCVEHLYEENKKPARRISQLRITGGQAAALCYLMGCSASDGFAYRAECPPGEKKLDWSRMDKAKEFWALVGITDAKDSRHLAFKPLREALGRLVDSEPDAQGDNRGLGGRWMERLCLIQGAWEAWVEGYALTDLDRREGGRLWLHYTDMSEPNAKGETSKLPDGGIRLGDVADFGGIDLPGRGKNLGVDSEPPPSPDELAARMAEVRRQAAESAAK